MERRFVWLGDIEMHKSTWLRPEVVCRAVNGAADWGQVRVEISGECRYFDTTPTGPSDRIRSDDEMGWRDATPVVGWITKQMTREWGGNALHSYGKTASFLSKDEDRIFLARILNELIKEEKTRHRTP